MKSILTVERFIVGQMAENCYLVKEMQTGKAMIVDPGDDAEYIIEKTTRLRAQPTCIVATHGHFDHIMAARTLQLTYKIPFFIHRDDLFLLRRMQHAAKHFLGVKADPPPEPSSIAENGILLGSIPITIIHTAGHTPGSICLHVPTETIAFVGDTIFAGGSVGRTDYSYSDPGQLIQSLHTIFTFTPDTVLYPGHGEATSVGSERSLHGA